MAPTDVSQLIAAIEDSGASSPAMISPLVTQGSARGPWAPSDAQYSMACR